MLGSEFVQAYSRKGPAVWEQAALDQARAGFLVPWPTVDVTLSDGTDTVILSVQSDVLAIGTLEDYVRMPLTTPYAQSIANLYGALLPTPWIEYAIWQTAPAKLDPIGMVPNLGDNLEQYYAHSKKIDEQLRAGSIARGTLVSGIKKGVVVANFYKTGKVLLFGWYRPSPPAPNVFDDGRPMEVLDRQPIQPKSNIHAEGYVDYSQVVRLIAPTCKVNGQVMQTVAIYQHPTLSRLVNPDNVNPPDQRGPIKVPRYPAPVPPPSGQSAYTFPVSYVPYTPDPTDVILDALTRKT